MSNLRPYERTDWESEQHKDATDAAQDADAAAIHADETMKDLIKTSKDIAASTQAVEQLTRDSLIADNKRFRRRNAVLVLLLSAVLLLVGIMVYRDVFIVGPQRDEIEEIALTLEECTTPGPHTPTAEDPSTGHECYDRSQAGQAKAIAQIVDADGNGKIDSQEILDAIKRFEVFLNVPGAE